jgi:hypothetical protein
MIAPGIQEPEFVCPAKSQVEDMQLPSGLLQSHQKQPMSTLEGAPFSSEDFAPLSINKLGRLGEQ